MIQLNGITITEAKEILKSQTPKEVLTFYNEPYNITEEQIEFYNQNGFIILKDVLIGPALEFAKTVMEAAVLIRKKEDERSLSEKSPYEQSFLQCGFLAFDFQPVKDYVFGKRFAGIARDLMRVDGIRLWHDQALFKEAGGRATPVHQDSSYWPLSNPELSTTIWLSLDNAPKEKGCLYFYPKSHLAKKEYVDIFKNPHQPKQLQDFKKVYAPLNAGDASYHSGLTFHGTEENTTGDLREGMTMIYIHDGNRFDGSDRRNATHKSCEGLKNGEKIDTKYTPKLI
ncbi:MAG: phytanoyl-CoA dioxygenase family protein [Calditrichaeota bacterium]|nr:MAG: phytanoyl-CoA dioxygenase family protein [Calditrichota bacterium]MBL1206647.1 phytanoyl-CoA dioxygenase family protein [Calditrichota bacterium]NOG46474.1 phytanoyl-CoA dioxygenase family protein [Calditrichota bacterium]